MVPGEYDSLNDPDPNSLLFGSDDEDAYAAQPPAGYAPRSSRADRAHSRRVKRNRRTFRVLAAVVVIVLAVVGYGTYHVISDQLHPKDYSGQGTGAVRIPVHSGDGASTIGDTLEKAGVVASSRAFVKAASDNPDAANISPGTYTLRLHMSAKNAVALLLDPATRSSAAAVVFEGATVFDVTAPLAKALGVSTAAVKAAIDDVANLGLPSGYTRDGKAPTSVEGFLYPATYTFDPGTKPADALQEMITNFIDKDRSSGFAGEAAAAHLTPYAALIIASIAEKEAKMAADYPKVARVILNRIAANMPLQIDATSAYAAKIKGLDPTKVIYNEIVSPYNTYTHDGLPPTPIANPGETAISAAVHPAAGNWLYYVNGDKAGDLFFTNDPNAFDRAVTKCRDNHWGCG